MKRITVVLIGLLFVSGSSALLSAKGLTTKIQITGTTLAAPVEITDPEILKNFNVWSGPGTFMNGVEGTKGFIVDWASGIVAEPPIGLAVYEVAFYVKYANRPASKQEDQLAYVVRYEIGPGGQGFVYLPGSADKQYGLNVRAIHRGLDGNWFPATPEWRKGAGQRIAAR